ncbi:MAG TPA: hypothetical protein P5228_05120 [Bacteroidales bacterium]|nr:hypothetical protein [Bacteroidales bacterium]
MKKLEKILGLVIIIALLLKLVLIPGGSILTVISLTILACIYYPLGFAFFNGIRLRAIFKKDSYKGVSALRIIGAIGLGMGLAAICIGILFKLQHWPGGDTNLIAGLVTTLIILIIALIKYLKSKSDYYKLIFSRIAIIGGFGLILAILPESTITKIQFRNHPDYIKAYEDYLKNPQNEELRKKEDVEYHRATMSDEEFDMYMKYLQNQADSV